LDVEDESDIFSEESDDFEEDSDGDSDTSSVVNESVSYEEVSDFLHLFVPHGVVRTRFAFLGVSGVNVDFDDEISFLELFRSLLMKICGSCLLNKQTCMPTNFWQQILI